MKFPCTGVILAGGLNTRLSGKNKAFIEIGNKKIIDHIYKVFAGIFDEIIIVTNDPLSYLNWDVKIVADIYPAKSSMTGLHAGLFFANNPFAFIIPCDTPFLKQDIINLILDHIKPEIDVVIPRTSGGLEPLCAVYSKNCISHLELNLSRKRYKIKGFFNKLKVREVSEKKLRQQDKDLISFININTNEDIIMAEHLLKSTIP